jgi:hypothetical protein
MKSMEMKRLRNMKKNKNKEDKQEDRINSNMIMIIIKEEIKTSTMVAKVTINKIETIKNMIMIDLDNKETMIIDSNIITRKNNSLLNNFMSKLKRLREWEFILQRLAISLCSQTQEK